MTEESVLKYEDSEWHGLAQPSQRNFYKDKKFIRLLNGKIKFKRIKGKNKKPHKFPFERCLDFNRAEITWEIRNDSRIITKQLQLSKLMRRREYKLLQQNKKLVSLKKKEDLVELKFKIRRKKYQIKTRQRKLRKKLTATHFINQWLGSSRKKYSDYLETKELGFNDLEIFSSLIEIDQLPRLKCSFCLKVLNKENGCNTLCDCKIKFCISCFKKRVKKEVLNKGKKPKCLCGHVLLYPEGFCGEKFSDGGGCFKECCFACKPSKKMMSSRWNLRKVEKDYSERNWYYILGPEFVKLRDGGDSIFWPHSFFHYLEAHVRAHSKKSNKRVSSITYALASTLLFGSMMGENNTPRNPDSSLSRLSTYDKHFTCNFNRGIAGYLGGDITCNTKVLVKETAKSILQKEKERFLQKEMERFINDLSRYGPSRRDNRNWDEAPAFDYPFDGYISEGDDDCLSDSTSGYDSDTSCQQNGISYKNSDTESDTSSTSGYDSDTSSEQSTISSIHVSLSESDSSSTSGYNSDTSSICTDL